MSFYSDLTIVNAKRQCEKYRAGKALPPKIPRREKGSSGAPKIGPVTEETEKAGGGYTPSGPSLRNTFTFNTVEFSVRHLPLLENFPRDYQSFLGISSTHLMNLLKVQLLRSY